MEFLKDILGDGYSDFEQKINDYNGAEENKDKQIKLANLASGDYVSKEKYTSLETEKNGYKTQLDNVGEEIESYKSMDIEGIKKAADDWKTKYEADTQKLQGEIQQQHVNHEAEKYINTFKFSSELAKRAALSEFKAKSFELKESGFVGADEYMKELQKKDPASFVVKEDEPPTEPKKWVRGTGGSYRPNIDGKEEAYLKSKYGNNKYYKNKGE